ncbi:MAG: hypothetical protein Kow001_20130 [Acidobacteriota bacterium]
MKVLLVQCCHLPQWFFIWKKLEDLHPEWEIQGLATSHEDARYYARLLVPDRVVHFLGDGALPDDFDLVVFPLTNRGYFRIRRAAWRLSARKLSADFEGGIGELSGRRLWLAAVRPPVRPTAEFVEQYSYFPHRPLGERVLVVESCHPAQVKQTEESLRHHLRVRQEVTRIGREGVWQAWRAVKGKAFDGALIYDSGEPGYFLVRLIPFLLGIRRILVVNETGDFFQAGVRTLAAWMLRRLWLGHMPRLWAPRILLVQTEDWRYAAAAVQRLREERLFPKARILLVARNQDREELDGLDPAVERFWLPSRCSWRDLWTLWKAVRAFDPDFNAAIFTGSPVFRWQKLLFFLLGSRRSFIFNARLDGYWLSLRTLARLWRREPLLFGLGASRTVLLVQTEGVEYTRAALERLQGGRLFSGARVILWCRRQDREAFSDLQEVQVESYGRDWREVWALWRRATRLKPEAAFGIFTGRPVFRLAKILFWLAPCRRRFAFNAQLDGYWVNWRTVGRMRRVEPLLFQPASRSGVPVVLVQTEIAEYVRAAAERIRAPRLFPGARVLLVCREADAPSLAQIPGLERVLTFRSGASWREFFHLLREVRRFRPQVRAAVMTGRPVFRGARLLFLCSGWRRGLVFNAALDAYWLSPGTFRRLWRREPLLFGQHHAGPQGVLLFETESTETMAKVVSVLNRPHVAGGSPIVVFCHEERARFYLSQPGVERTICYGKQNRREDLRAVLQVLRERPGAVAAVLSGRPVFTLHKLLFWLAPSRNKLIFNPVLDCFYLSRENFRLLFRWGRQPEHGSSLEAVLRPVVKAILFLPRFGYLILWSRWARRGGLGTADPRSV